MPAPYSIRIFQLDGDPNGVRTIDKTGWTGQALAFPRALIGAAAKREELRRTGVYMLIGEAADSAMPKVYIGEGDPVLGRIKSHEANKDFWNFCVAFTSKDEALNKAHVQYLESRLVGLAADAKLCELANGNMPELPSLSEADEADAEAFLQEIFLCLPALGLGIFRQRPATVVSDKILLRIEAKGVSATGQDMSEGFLVMKGSRASKQDTATMPGGARNLRQNLLKLGVLRDEEDAYVFAQDYLFSSSSSAAAVIQARSASGPLSWKTSAGKTLGEIQSA